MAGTLERLPRAARLRALATHYVRMSGALALLLLAVRVYEQIIAGPAHRMGAAGAWLHAVLADFTFTSWVAVCCAVPTVVIALVAPRVVRHLYHAVIAIVVLSAVALAQYFSVTGVPLGADLFGYRWRDIQETVGSSGGVTAAAIAAFICFAVVAAILPRWVKRIPCPPRATAASGVVLFAAVAATPMLAPSPTEFVSDSQYLSVVSKPGWFVQRSARFVVNAWRDARDAAALSGYPLMHPVTYDDVLGPQFALGDAKPNFVFVIVEGLGRDFTGPGAAYGGFTPFLDSLTARSLTWDNFLSTSGRTFGVLPSLLGSLPFGRSGFMELGDQMPAHASLITLLRQAGYASNYFTGTNGAFDRIDVFMERQNVDRFVDAASFGPSYEKMPAEPGGESWGYPDAALFRRSLELLDANSSVPRVDVYLTISTHEPFIPPARARYATRFNQRLRDLRVDDARRAAYEASRDVFESLLYTDDALRAFLTSYAARPDYGRTIFFITGDHRLVPVPPSSRLARYHVPFIVYSPMLRAPHHVRAVSSHFDVMPSLLAMLRRRYQITVPDSAPWIGAGLDTAQHFGGVHRLPLMRTKNELDEYFTGTGYLTGGRYYRVDSTLSLSDEDAGAGDEARDALRRFRAANAYTTTRNRVTPARALGVTPIPDHAAVAAEDSVFRELGLDRVTPEQSFEVARDLAMRRDYRAARFILRHLLRQAPSYHDARALLGRTYAWDEKLDSARTILDDLVRRAPSYPDGLGARLEVEIYAGDGRAALAAADRALSQFPTDATLLYDKARALELMGDKAGALRELDAVQRVMPSHADARALRQRLSTR